MKGWQKPFSIITKLWFYMLVDFKPILVHWKLSKIKNFSEMNYQNKKKCNIYSFHFLFKLQVYD